MASAPEEQGSTQDREVENEKPRVDLVYQDKERKSVDIYIK
jgi:hypothetical protein